MNNVDNVFNNSKKFSFNILDRLRKAKTLNDSFIAGSISRYEALPMADIDILDFEKNNDLREIIIENIDRIDYIRMDDITADRLIENMSPESGFLDCKPIFGNQNHKFYFRYNNSQFLLNQFIWEYHFRFLNERSDNLNYNLKYSVGGYRDILLINLFAKFLDNNYCAGIAEILQSLEKLKHLIRYNYLDLRESIASIMITKSAILLAHSSSATRGRTQLNQKTLEESLKQNFQFSNFYYNSKREFWTRYLNDKKVISNFLRIIYTYVENNYADFYFSYIRTAIDNLNKYKLLDFKKILNQEDAYHYPILASIILNNNCSGQVLDEIAKGIASDPGHYYTNRLIVKSQKTHKRTLKFLLSNSKFALEDWTNNRYKEIIKERLSLRV